MAFAAADCWSLLCQSSSSSLSKVNFSFLSCSNFARSSAEEPHWALRFKRATLILVKSNRERETHNSHIRRWRKNGLEGWGPQWIDQRTRFENLQAVVGGDLKLRASWKNNPQWNVKELGKRTECFKKNWEGPKTVSLVFLRDFSAWGEEVEGRSWDEQREFLGFRDLIWNWSRSSYSTSRRFWRDYEELIMW